MCRGFFYLFFFFLVSFLRGWGKGVITKKAFQKRLFLKKQTNKFKIKYVSPCIEQHFTANNFCCIAGQVIGITSSQETTCNCNDVNHNWIEEEKEERERTEERRKERKDNDNKSNGLYVSLL